MKKSVLLVVFLFSTTVGLCQTGKDTIVYNLPTVDGKLIYTGGAELKNKASYSVAKKWLFGYFNLSEANATTPLAKHDTTNLTLRRGLLDYYVKPGLIKINFIAIANIKINLTANKYTYKIDSIYFRPKNNVLNELGYQNSPEYLIELYKQKHLGLFTSMQLDRNMIRKYLSAINAAVLECITSLNKAMAN
jgi:hypothetical protein